MTNIIVADTGPLIALSIVDLLSVLPKLFEAVYVPQAVLTEATADASRPGAQTILAACDCGWLLPKKIRITETFQALIEILDQGEAEALCLAQTLKAIALIDERRGRRAATSQGIPVIGTAAILLKAKQAGLTQQLKPKLTLLGQQGYRLSEALVTEILKRAQEHWRKAV